jgi:hypothetical protein
MARSETIGEHAPRFYTGRQSRGGSGCGRVSIAWALTTPHLPLETFDERVLTAAGAS